MVERPDFRTWARQRVLVGDGAMATLLHRYGAPIRTCYPALSVSHPEWVRQIHKEYLGAGADLIQTNTFGAQRTGLDRYGLADELEAINLASVRVAQEAMEQMNLDRPVYVFGTVGSVLSFQNAPAIMSPDHAAAVKSEFAEQVRILLAGGVDGLLLETFADLSEMRLALETVRSLTSLPVLAHLAPETVGVTRDGVPVSTALQEMRRLGADIVGLNCHLGPRGILRTYEGFQLDPELTYSAEPNAGMLHQVEGDYSYTGSTGYFAGVAEQLLASGVTLLGGCCGTTPEHIRRLAELARKANEQGVVPEQQKRAAWARPVSVSSSALPSNLALSDGEGSRPMVVDPTQGSVVDWVRQRQTVIVELDPPKTLDVGAYLKGARALQEAGVDAITLADNSLGTVRVDNMALASLLKNMGIEPLVHMTCRDRNLIGQQSHLMGLHVLGIHQLLLVTGDPTRYGDLPGATPVYDVSSIELTRMVKQLNQGVAFSGQPLSHPARFVVGTSFNPHVVNFNRAVERLGRKVMAGADFIMTQPIYEESMFEAIAKATEPLRVPVFVGIMPLVSTRNATFLHNEVPGIRIPESLLARMAATPQDQATEEGLRIAEQLIDRARQYFRGIYLVTPFLRYRMTAHLTRYIKSTH